MCYIVIKCILEALLDKIPIINSVPLDGLAEIKCLIAVLTGFFLHFYAGVVVFVTSGPNRKEHRQC